MNTKHHNHNTAASVATPHWLRSAYPLWHNCRARSKGCHTEHPSPENSLLNSGCRKPHMACRNATTQVRHAYEITRPGSIHRPQHTGHEQGTHAVILARRAAAAVTSASAQACAAPARPRGARPAGSRCVQQAHAKGALEEGCTHLVPAATPRLDTTHHALPPFMSLCHPLLLLGS